MKRGPTMIVQPSYGNGPFPKGEFFRQFKTEQKLNKFAID